MSYIKSYGVAFPKFRVGDNVLHPKGKNGVTKAVCFPDEDIITLAYQSACTLPKENIDGLLFATSTQVFQNRYHASYLADLLHLPQGILALDFTTSTRGGTDALLLAHNLVENGKYRNILVIASDVCFPEIGKERVTPFGHGACSILVGMGTSGIQITSAQTYSAAFAEEFQYKGKAIQYDPRFSRETGFKTNIEQVVKKLETDPKSIDAIILNSVYARMAVGVFAKAGFDEKQFARDTISSKIGNTGAPHALLLLVNELELGKKNILLADYTNGTNLFHVQNNTNIETPVLKGALANCESVTCYQDYLLLYKAGNFNAPNYIPKEIFTSEMMQEREKGMLLYLEGHQCSNCGTTYYVKTTRCKKCNSTGFTKVQLSKTGTVFACTNEHYYPATFPPVSMLIINLDGGGRVTVQQTDTMYPENNKVGIGTRVGLVLRKMIENDAKPDYFWKAIAI